MLHVTKKTTLNMSQPKNIKYLQTTLQEIPKNPSSVGIQNNVCACGNAYKHRQSLYKHKKYCEILKKCDVDVNNDDTIQPINFDTNVVLDLVQKNQEISERNVFRNAKTNV